MRILLLVVYYLPSTSSAAKLINDLAIEFTIRGHDVTVVAPDHATEADIQCDYDDKVRVIRVKTGEIKGATRILRGYREISLSKILWKRAKKFFNENAFDLIIYYSPTTPSIGTSYIASCQEKSDKSVSGSISNTL